MFRFQILDKTAAEDFKLLAFPSLHSKLAESGSVAVGATVMGVPAGLALGEVLPGGKQGLVHSLVVLRPYRGGGLGTALLNQLEQALQQQGCAGLALEYAGNLPALAPLTRILEKGGWSRPEISAYSYLTTITGEQAREFEWLKAVAPLPADCSFFRWSELAPEELENLNHLLETDPRYSGAVPPFEAGVGAGYEPLNSVGLRCRGEIAGWQITLRHSPDTIRFGPFFMRRDLDAAWLTYNLIAEAMRLQVEQEIPHLLWQWPAHNPESLNFVQNFIEPFSPVASNTFRATKSLEPAPDAGLSGVNNLVELLQARASRYPEQTAFIFLPDGETQELSMSYRELDLAARRIAVRLRRDAGPGERVLICLPSGLEYITAFFGCLYAGQVPVAAYPPEPARLKRSLARLEAIIKKVGASLALTRAELLPQMEQMVAETSPSRPVNWLSIEQAGSEDEKAWVAPEINAQDMAFMVFTSGTTGQPHGVMVSHFNALFNLKAFTGFEERPFRGFVSWLPFSHDLGLFFCILHPIYRGVPSIFMPSLAFMQRPVRWLKAISRYKATATGGPNFAYDFCVQKITPEEREGLDLSSWNLALNGAEPVRLETLERFTRTFQPYGFRLETFYPSYGSADASCTISGGSKYEKPVTFRLDPAVLRQNRVEPASADSTRTLVGCGKILPGQQIVIVDPVTLTPCPPDRIGEIWVKGEGIPAGYWDEPELTARVFQAYLAESGEGPFLRTGDLGFVREEEVFITGRFKDMIIIRGLKHLPQDIELTAEKSHPALRKGSVIAFAVEANDKEGLVVVAEANPAQLAAQEVFGQIRQAIAEEHQLETQALVLVRPGAIPKTTSGKLQRSECKRQFLEGELEILAQWLTGTEAPALESKAEANAGTAAQTPPGPAKTISDWLVNHLARKLKLLPEEINPRRTFAHYGLVSVEAVGMVRDLEILLKRPLSPTLAWDFPSIEELTRHLSDLPPAEVAAAEAAASLPDTPAGPEPIAIVGLACRYPGAKNLEEFWQLLLEGRDTVTEVPADRWDKDAFYDPDPAKPAKMTTRWGGFLPDVDRFDPLFFGISPREAYHLDPRQRLLLETAWEALEDAGIPPEKLAGSQTGVFTANLVGDYSSAVFTDLSRIEAFSGTGTANSILSNRLSYFLDLHGPSLTVDTACSGSLVALHLACQSLKNGECETALIGGVNLLLGPASNLFFSKAEALAADGRCKVFDARADGIVRSEGTGVAVLKPLSRAIQDGDRIYALVKGSAVNSDGRSKGIMAPNRQAQEAVLRSAYRQAGLRPSQVQYVEAHGTGTKLGDPIEVQALGTVLGENRSGEWLCAIGSIKTNFGHTEAAAGMAGLIKIALSLKNRVLPPTLHFEQPNPLIPFERLPFKVQNTMSEWPAPSQPLIAGLSSFGFGGTNAHIVLQEYAPLEAPLPETSSVGRPYLLPLSAQSKEALADSARRYLDFLRKPASASLQDVCYTASQRRAHFPQRLAVAGRSREELADRLEAFLQQPDWPEKEAAPARKLVFVFSGQGSHWPGMGRELAQREPVFRDTLQEIDGLLRQHVSWSLMEELNAAPEVSNLNRTEITQPAIFAVQVALAALWRSWGLQPVVVVGQSLGEVAAACVAGVLTLPEAVQVVVDRSRLMQRVAGQGKTAVVDLPFEQAQLAISACDDVLAVAGSNSPTSSVLSGDPAMLQRVLDSLERKKVFCRMLPGVDVAFHSPQMDLLKDELVAALEFITPRSAQLPLFSSVTGQAIDGPELDAAYWGRNLRDPFMFSRAVENIVAAGYSAFLEVSPHPVLASSINQSLRSLNRKGTSLPSLSRDKDEQLALYNSLAEFYTLGFDLNWPAIYPTKGAVVALPHYPWQRERYWIDQLPGKGLLFSPEDGKFFRLHAGADSSEPARLLPEHLELAERPGNHLWQGQLSANYPAFLSDHKVGERVALPGAAWLEMALSAAREIYPAGGLELRGVEFKEALFLPANSFRSVQLALSPAEEGGYSFRIFSQPVVPGNARSAWTLHASGKLVGPPGNHESPNYNHQTTITKLQSLPDRLSAAQHYQNMQERGLNYGPQFQAVQQIWWRNGEALAKLQLPSGLEDDQGLYELHPVMLDAAFQAVSAAFQPQETASGLNERYLPVGVEKIRVYEPGSRVAWSRAVLNPDHQPGIAAADLYLLGEDGRVIAEVSGLQLKRITGTTPAFYGNPLDWLYQIEWQPQSAPAAAPGNAVSWLIFAGQGEAGEQLKQRLEAAGEECLLARPGEDYRLEAGAGRVQLNPIRPEEMKQLLTAFQSLARFNNTGIIYLWGMDVCEQAEPQLDHCEGALHLIQAMAGLDWKHQPRLWVVTRGAQAVETAPNLTGLSQMPLWGLAGVIANEHVEFSCVRVDLSPVPDSGEIDRLAAELRQSGSESQVAFRGPVRYVPRFVALKNKADLPEEIFLDAGATYLITGGLGGLGLAVAAGLVERGARHLALVGRTAPGPETRQALDTLSEKGATVRVIPADIASLPDVERLMAEIDASMPPLKGVIQAAAIVDDSILRDASFARLAKIMAPKVQGSWNLHRLTLDRQLDFFVLFSSISTLLCPPTQGGYVAGNSFMDGLANFRRQLGLPGLVINWGPWSSVGLAARSERNDRLLTKGVGSIPVEEGVALLGRLLESDTTRVTVIPADWELLSRSDPLIAKSPVLKPLISAAREKKAALNGNSQAAGIALSLDKLHKGSAAARQEWLEDYLCRTVARVLGLPVERVDKTLSLYRLGLDSLLSVEIKNWLEADLGLVVPVARLLEGPPINELATGIISQLQESNPVTWKEHSDESVTG